MTKHDLNIHNMYPVYQMLQVKDTKDMVR